jgi:hypothetical protein
MAGIEAVSLVKTKFKGWDAWKIGKGGKISKAEIGTWSTQGMCMIPESFVSVLTI